MVTLQQKRELAGAKEEKGVVADREHREVQAIRDAPIVPGLLKARVRQDDGFTLALGSDFMLSCLPGSVSLNGPSKQVCGGHAWSSGYSMSDSWDKTRNGLRVPHRRSSYKITPCHERKYTAIFVLISGKY